MFTNYSQTYATQLTALAGAIVILGRIMGWELSESDILFVLAVLANLYGILKPVYERYLKGGVTILGARI